MAFIDLGDQFIALQKGRNQSADAGRHFGLVDDKEAPDALIAPVRLISPDWYLDGVSPNTAPTA